MENVSILCVGDVTIDRFFRLDESEAQLLCRHSDCEIAFKYGEKISVDFYHKSFGGSALNTAIGFSRLEMNSAISTIVGDDTDGNDLNSLLLSSGVNCALILSEGETNQSAVIIYKNERTIFSYHKDRDYEKLSLPRTDWIYLSSAGIGFERMISKLINAADLAAKIALNPGSAELKNFELLSRIVKRSEILFLNKQEAEMLFDEENISNLLNKILERGARVAVITDGANGAYIASADGMFHMGIAPSTLVDSTGAGDSFACGFTAGVANGLSLEESAKWGMVNSASVIGKIGANSGLLDLAEIKRRAGEATILTANKI